MKNVLSVAVACAMAFSFAYGFTYKPDDGKLHCKVCNGTHFVPSKRYTKFIGTDNNSFLKTASFYLSSACGHPTYIVIN